MLGSGGAIRSGFGSHVPGVGVGRDEQVYAQHLASLDGDVAQRYGVHLSPYVKGLTLEMIP